MLLFKNPHVYAQASDSDSDSDGGDGEQWWKLRGAYANPADRPGVVDAIIKLRGPKGAADPATYPTLSLLRRYKDARRQRRLQQQKAARRSGSETPSQSRAKSAVAAATGVSAMRAALGGGYAMYFGRRKESALVSSIDSTVARALDATGGGDAALPLSQQQLFASAHAPFDAGSSPLNAGPRPSLSLAASIAGARFSCGGAAVASPVHVTTTDRTTLQQTPSVSDAKRWETIIRRCNSGVPVFTKQGRRAVTLGEKGELSSIISNSPSNGGLSPLDHLTPDASCGALGPDDGCSFDCALARQTIDLTQCVDALLAHME